MADFAPIRDVGRSLCRAATNKNHRLVCRQTMPNQVILVLHGAQSGLSKAARRKRRGHLWLRKQRRRRRRKRPKQRKK